MAKTAREVLEGEFSSQQPKKAKLMKAFRSSGPVQGERYDAPVTKPAAKSKGAWTQAQKEQAVRERKAAAQAAGKKAKGAWTQAEKEQAMRERRAAAMAKKNKG